MTNIILSHGYFIKEDAKEQAIMKPYPPLGILYLSAWLERFGHRHEVYDTTFSTKIEFEKHLTKSRPDVLALYTNLMTKLNIIDILAFVNEELPDTFIILGGPDITHNTKDYLSVGADLVIIGEGEQTLLEVIQSIEKGNRTHFGHINGVACYVDGEYLQTPSRERIRPIDDLPLPNRKQIDMQPYLDTWKKHHGKSAMTVSTQRGCPYTCKWCSTAVYGQSYRRRSPQLVAQELKTLKEAYNPDSIWFVDDVFSVSHKWVEAFVDEVRKQDALIPFECITRADRMNEQVIDWLKAAGCYRIWIGAESGSQRVIDLMDRRVDVDYVSEMIKLTKQKGIEAGTFIMLGYPGETEEDIRETIAYLKDCQPDHFTITVAYPIKGTSMYAEVEAKQIEELDWASTTDRDRDFKRTYSRKYYDYAVRWVVNEVNKTKTSSKLEMLKHAIKSRVMRMRMQQHKLLP